MSFLILKLKKLYSTVRFVVQSHLSLVVESRDPQTAQGAVTPPSLRACPQPPSPLG